MRKSAPFAVNHLDKKYLVQGRGDCEEKLGRMKKGGGSGTLPPSSEDIYARVVALVNNLVALAKMT